MYDHHTYISALLNSQAPWRSKEIQAHHSAICFHITPSYLTEGLTGLEFPYKHKGQGESPCRARASPLQGSDFGVGGHEADGNKGPIRAGRVECLCRASPHAHSASCCSHHQPLEPKSCVCCTISYWS